jgi:hypothetical protein
VAEAGEEEREEPEPLGREWPGPAAPVWELDRPEQAQESDPERAENSFRGNKRPSRRDARIGT